MGKNPGQTTYAIALAAVALIFFVMVITTLQSGNAVPPTATPNIPPSIVVAPALAPTPTK